MRLFSSDRSRAALLIVSLSLIGGTGCITASIVNSVQQKNAQRASAEMQKTKIEGYKVAASRGDLEATTQLGLEYINGSPNLERDIPTGISLLEQAAAKQYGPAEYALGWLLLNGSNRQYNGRTLSAEQLPPDPSRGIELLKRSSTRSCSPSPVFFNRFSAFDVSDIYRNSGTNNGINSGINSAIIRQDMQQADLWLARSILDCKYPFHTTIKYKFLGSTEAGTAAKIKALAFLLMLPASDTLTKLQASMSPADIQAAQEKMAMLRQAALESKQQYPAPPYPSQR
ncbi:sel1 repeat family protein [Collimonas antrihumi]|uniref:sel1 repeat family protein n=1 Tax=Collimonas antrihumi TaxID=1940615 RepID=UPI001B8BA732|nr:sel1 repeat family protein [Collimonas antrihumi]